MDFLDEQVGSSSSPPRVTTCTGIGRKAVSEGVASCTASATVAGVTPASRMHVGTARHGGGSRQPRGSLQVPPLLDSSRQQSKEKGAS